MSALPVSSATLSDARLGVVRVWATTGGVRRVDFVDEDGPPGDPPRDALAAAHLEDALEQLAAYLAGARRAFEVELDLSGVSPFQRKVYDRLRRIPFGQVVTYGRVAEDIGADPTSAARAVGGAVGANPVAILVPCHRVVGANGKLTGFAGGPERKARLLAHEGIHVDGELASSKVHPDVLRLPL